ncbi:hypothetical protein QAD02_016370 [Eretmocerus hayati]|uniref:Uncharacterized protein n=1 Tax=Eretmocerus hayati TaxID=131215 RepID=A0ACC2PBW7_9HYME|nr:hypothetical protein QAD02_016370 [Eretmocerus hayati]
MEARTKLLLLMGMIVIASFGTHKLISWVSHSAKKNPHIILIVVDDMGWNDVSFHGADEIPTPNIDALAYSGVILNRHYTLPICTPSRSSLMTGRYAIRDGMQGWPLGGGEPRGVPLNITLLPEYLRRLGYSTHLVGKWHLGYMTKDYTPTRRGFDTFYGCYNGWITYFSHLHFQKVADDLPLISGYDLHRDKPETLKPEYDYNYMTDLITDEAVRIIKDNGNKKSIFMEISHVAVHASEGNDTLEVRNMTEIDESFPHIKDISRRKYAGMMKAMDESIGQVMKALSDANMLENSIIIFMSDNGGPTIGLYENTASNYPLRGMKQTLFEGGVRSAACIFSNLIKFPSRVSNGLIHLVDWLPTLYVAAGGKIEDLKDIDGVNQWPTLVNGQESPRKSVLLNIDEVRHAESAVIGHHKLIRGTEVDNNDYYGTNGNDASYPRYRVESALSSPTGSVIKQLPNFKFPSTSEAMGMRRKSAIKCHPHTNHPKCIISHCLFDIENDPCETQDLSGKHPEVVESLQSFIHDYRLVMMKQTNAPHDPCSNPKYFNGTWMPWREIHIPNDPRPTKCK